MPTEPRQPTAATEPVTPASLERWRPTPLKALEREVIPTDLHFLRDHFPAPALDVDSWSLTLTGASRNLELTLKQLRNLPAHTLSVVLECAGHRRVEFETPPPGVPWACGAVAEAKWTGVSLQALLHQIGIPPDAREIVLEGADSGPVQGFDGIHHFARSLPLAKAFDPDVLLAYEMNGQPLPHEHGGPVRAIVPGWYATDSVKWLTRVWFSEEEFDGVFQAYDYRLQAPGEPGPGARMTALPVHALITAPEDGEAERPAGELEVRGVVWGGAKGIAAVQIQIDDGPWRPARLEAAEGGYARVGWQTTCELGAGWHQIACRAIDGTGRSQPDRPPPNVGGYGNNAVHRVRVRAL